KVFKNEQVKRQVSHGRKYRKWITRNMVFPARLSPETVALARAEEKAPEGNGNGDHRGARGAGQGLASFDRATFVATQRAAGYTEEDLELLIKPLAGEKKEPVGSMGDDTPLAALSRRPRPL